MIDHYGMKTIKPEKIAANKKMAPIYQKTKKKLS
jgi:hypothetical protein